MRRLLGALLIGSVASGAPIRQLQAGGGCNGAMQEMNTIAANCCGSNMQYCSGATPSQCDDTCKPVFESFFSRCTDMISRDPNRAAYEAFQQMCHPPSDDTSEVLWSDDFESGLGKWRGKTDANAPDTAVIDDDPDHGGNHALHVTGCHGGGDAFSVDSFQCTLEEPCLVSYRARGRPWQGFAAGFPENHAWTAIPDLSYQNGNGIHYQTTHDNENWQHIEYVFPVGDGHYTERDYTATIGATHFMLEGFDFDCENTYVDDIVISRYTGTPEQAAAINAARQPANVLFAEDFESGSSGWHGKGENPRPESAFVTESPDRGGMVMSFGACASGGDAFSTATFECTESERCLVSYWVKGRSWQGFAEGYPGNHIWTAVPDPNYMGGTGVHVQQRHDTANWRHIEYVFPDTATSTFVHGDAAASIGTVHIMFEGFDDDCSATFIDDITITRFGGTDAAAEGINRRANTNVDILFSATFEDGVPDGTPPRGWCGNDGPGTPPTTAVLGHDAEHGGVLQIMGCDSGGDAFSEATMMCTPQFQCAVSFFTKGRAWQGFADGFAGNHVWSATPDSGYMGGQGVMAQTVHDNDNWHLVEYIFPTTDTHVHGDETEPISEVRFMVEGNGADCEATMIDNIVVRRHTGVQQNWCTAGRECLTQASLPSSLVGYWPLDGDGTDLSGNDLTAEPTNPEWVAGMYLQALRFDGDDELRVSPNPLLEVSQVTMMAWVRPVTYSLAQRGDRGIIMNKENSFECGIEDNTGALQGAFNNGGSPGAHAAAGGCWRWFGTVRVPAHEWTHVAVSYDGSDEHHYVSGDHVEQASCRNGGDLVPTSASLAEQPGTFNGLKIGSRSWTPGQDAVGHSQFQGDIDEGMLFSEALAQPQIYSIYHRAFDANSGGQGITFIRAPSTVVLARLPPGLVGFWPLDGDGDDASGNNLGGTPTNPDWVAGLYNLAFRFDGDDAMVVPPAPQLNLNTLTMSAWLRPVDYDLADNADRGIIMNKESSYEMGLQDETGALQGAFSPCWRWFGETRIPIHEWTHVAMGFDGANELHYVHGVHSETDPCPGALAPSADPLRLGARSNSVSFADANFAHASQFQGDVDEVILFSRSLSETEISGIQSASYRDGGGMTNVYAAGEPDPALLPGGCVGFWPLDGTGTDIATGNNAQPDNEEWVKGLFGLAFRFDGDDALRVPRCNKATAEPWNLDVTRVSMVAWIRPQGYAIDYDADRGIIMNKESSYEFGLADNTGKLQGAFSPCWRWWGEVVIPLHEWSHVAVTYDGTNEAHYIMSQQVEAIACGNGGDLTPSQADFRIGHREARVGVLGHSNFQGDIDEAMVFDRPLGESDLHVVYRGHYRHAHTAGSRGVRASHNLDNNDVSGATGHKSAFARVNRKLIDRIDSLVGYWALDGDPSDSSGNDLDGRVANPEWVSGAYGLAIAFDGDDGLEVSADAINAMTIDDVTMAAWIKAEAGGNTGATFESTEGMIMCRDEAYEIALKSGTGELQAAFGTGGGTTGLPYSGSCWAWFGQQIIPAHEWTHVAVSFDHTTEQQIHYVSGMQVQTGSPCAPGAYNGNPLQVSELPFQIGARQHTRYTHHASDLTSTVGHAEFMGDIDEAMLFNAAISADQVDYIYSLQYRSRSAGPPLPRVPGSTATLEMPRLPSSLVGFWPLDGDGTDMGPNHLTGTDHDVDADPNWTAGRFGLAINFDDGDGFVVPDTGAMAAINAAVTMVAYVRPSQYESCGDRGILMNKEGSFEMGIESNTGALQAAASPCWRWFGNVRLSLYSWTLAAVSFDGTDEKHWINAVQMESDSCAGAITVNPSPLTIGARPAGNSVEASTEEPPWSQFTGDIDEVMLYSSALSARDMSNLFQVNYRSASMPLPVHGDPDLDALRSSTGANSADKSLVGFWPLDGDGEDLTDASSSTTFGQDLGENNLGLTATNAQYVTGVYGQAFRFDGDDLLETTETNALLDLDYVTMLAWVKPNSYSTREAGGNPDRGIIVNKENSYEMGLENGLGNLQGAFGPGCWRWFGGIRIPLHEWSHTAIVYDGSQEKHYVNGLLGESDACPGGALAKHPEAKLRIGARYWSSTGTDYASSSPSANFRGDIDEVLLFGARSPGGSLTDANVEYVYSGAYRSTGSQGGH